MNRLTNTQNKRFAIVFIGLFGFLFAISFFAIGFTKTVAAFIIATLAAVSLAGGIILMSKLIDWVEKG